MPVARAFDLAGAEWIFRYNMPEGLDLVDVHSDGDSKVVIEAEADPVWLLAIPAFIKAHWIAISLLSIGIMIGLSALVRSVSVLVKSPVTQDWKMIMMIGGAVALAYILTRPKGNTRRK